MENICAGGVIVGILGLAFVFHGRQGKETEEQVAYSTQLDAQNQKYAIPGVEGVVEKGNNFAQKMRIALRDTGFWLK